MRAFRPAATSVRVLPQRGEPVELARSARRGRVRGRAARAGARCPRYRLEVGYADAPSVVVRDAYSFAADARRARPAPHQRGPPRAALGRARRAPARRSTAPPARPSRSGRRARAPSASSATSTSGTSAPIPMRSLGAAGVWELFVPEAAAGHAYKFAIRGADGAVRLKADPCRAARPSCRRRPARSCFEPGYGWDDAAWLERRRAERAARGARSRSTRCTSARGGSTRSRATAR